MFNQDQLTQAQLNQFLALDDMQMDVTFMSAQDLCSFCAFDSLHYFSADELSSIYAEIMFAVDFYNPAGSFGMFCEDWTYSMLERYLVAVRDALYTAETGCSGLSVDDCLEVERNQAYREAVVVAVDGDKALIEYLMPNGTSALNIIDRDGDGSDYRSVGYWGLSTRWLDIVIASGVRWEGNPQKGRKAFSPNTIKAERLAA